MGRYILAVDQSTQATKAFLVDETGRITCRVAMPHRQLISSEGWVSHDLEEIYQNLLSAVSAVTESVDKNDITGVALTNQRETACAWDSKGEPLAQAVVWQCSRAQSVIESLNTDCLSSYIKNVTGLPLSPYFSAPKFVWLMQNESAVAQAAKLGQLHFGTVDSYLIYRLTGLHLTDVTNASRTMLMSLDTLQWDATLCGKLGISPEMLPRICSCDAHFGETDFAGILPHKLPILAVMGDSHAAFFAQGCTNVGDMKATYGTGSSVMMHIGSRPLPGSRGIVTSVGYACNGQTVYAYEGNVNYSGAVITWLKDQLGLISSPAETEELARAADPADRTVLVPAFSGLAAPHNDPHASAILTGMTRMTGRNEIVRAALECIAFQIRDIAASMAEQSGVPIQMLHADGGAVRNQYLMQFQADILNCDVGASSEEALSALGVARMAAKHELPASKELTRYVPRIPDTVRLEKLKCWTQALEQCASQYLS